MKGKLYGVGVGPGDPGLLTIRAKEVLESCDVVAYPVRKTGEGSTAYDIASKAVDLSGKRVEELLFDMDPDDSVRERCREAAMLKMCGILDSGDDVAMVTLGDVGVYSTYMHIDRDVASRGYETEVVPGIPSFCHGAALAGVPLMIGDEGLAVVPLAKENPGLLDASMESFDNVVVMKAFKSMPAIAAAMAAHGFPEDGATVVSNVGMEGEYIGPLDVGREYGYFTTVILKRNGGGAE